MTELSDREIADEAKLRRQRDQDRLRTYQKCRSAYFGDTEQGSNVRAMDGTGRPIERLDRTREELLARGGAPNMLQPIVDDFVSLRGPLPSMRVLPQNDEAAAKESSTKWSRVLRTQWQASNMDVQGFELAWQLSCLGDTLLTLTAVQPGDAIATVRPPGVYITVVDPSTAFPRHRFGWDREELYDVIVWEEIGPQTAKAEWSFVTSANKINVLHYCGPTRNCIVLDDGSRVQRVEEVVHNLGYCPAQWIRNKANGRYAQSDILTALDAHTEMQIQFLVMSDAIMEATYSQLVVEDPTALGERIEVGPGAPPIVVKAGGSVRRLEPGQPPRAAEMIVHATWEQIQRMCGSAPVRVESKIEGSNISGRAIHAVQGPMETRLAEKQTILGFHYQKLNSKILDMLFRLPGFKKSEMTVYGVEKGAPFAETFMGDELGGWTRNRVQWQAQIGSTTHERAVVGLQLKGETLVPDSWVLEQIGVDDPEQLVHEAREELIDKMHQQQAAQQPQGAPPDAAQTAKQGPAMMQGAMPSGAAGAPPQPQSPEAGGPVPAQPPPPMPNFPAQDRSPTALGMGTPAPVPDITAQIGKVMRAIGPRLAGDVLAVYPIKGGVHVDVATWEDKAVIRRAFSGAGLGKVEVEVSKAA